MLTATQIHAEASYRAERALARRRRSTPTPRAAVRTHPVRRTREAVGAAGIVSPSGAGIGHGVRPANA